MAVYNPPTEYNPIFNTSNFITSTTGLTESRANSLYLSKVNNDSTNTGVSSTTITNTLNVGTIISANFNAPTATIPVIFLSTIISGSVDIATNATSSSIRLGTALTTGLITQGKTTFNNTVTVSNGQTFFSNLVKSTSIIPEAHALFDNMPGGSSITIGNQLSSSSIALKGSVSVGTYGTAGGVLTLYRKLNIQDINGNTTGFAEIYYGNGPELGYYSISVPSTLNQTFHRFWNCAAGSSTPILRFEVGDAITITDGTILNTRQIKSTSTASTAHTLFDNMTTGGVLTIGNTASSNTINGNTNFSSIVSLKSRYKLVEYLNISTDTTFDVTYPLSPVYVIRTNVSAITINLPLVTVADAGFVIRLVKVQNNKTVTLTTPNGGTTKIIGLNDLISGGAYTNSNLLGVDKIQTTLVAGFIGATVYWLECSDYSTFDRDYNNTIYPRLTTSNDFTNRLNFSASSYSFPFASSQSLGYYLKTTGTAFTTLTTSTPKTIVSTTSIPIGVWRIDFSVINLVTSAGTITQSQTYISPTTDGNVGTAVDFTGSVIRSHISEVYALNDVQEITGSFTYQQTTAGVLRLNIVKSFGSGTYSFTGEIAITRIA